MEKLLPYKALLWEIELNVAMVGVSQVHPNGVEAVPGHTGVTSCPVEIEKINIAERQPLQSLGGFLQIILSKFKYFDFCNVKPLILL